MWELEIFLNRMKYLRGWSAEHAIMVHNDLETKPSTLIDHNGFNHAKRISIPSNLVGEDFFERAKGEFEEKAIEHSSKEKRGLTEEEEGRAKAELHTGFSRLSSSSCADLTFHATLAPTAMTIESSS
eukprot:11173485-Lingulodinium_polyedra.AAC.1